jgi:outer membrane protein assembly factor BamD
MVRRSFACFVVALSLAGAATGCENEEPKTALNYTADAKRAYEAAMVEFDDHNWLEAQNKMREIKRKYSYSKYARLAELRIADADYAQEKYADAIRGYRQFVHDHRSDTDEVSYARSRIAEAEYAQIGDSFLLPASEERDQAIILDAYKEVRGYIHDYPDAKESPHMRALLADVTGRLIRHELYVARFYLQKDNYEAAILRIQYALRNYADPRETADSAESLEPDALLLLGETYLKLHKWREAKESFGIIVARYQASGLTVPAQKYLDYMHDQGVDKL